MLVHVAVAMLGLLAFSALVIDYGIMWAAAGRRRTPPMPPRWPARWPWPTTRRATSIAHARRPSVGESHKVFGAAPTSSWARRATSTSRQDISFPAVPSGRRVDRHVRPGERLPQRRAQQPAADVLRAAGRHHSQDIKATATAKVLTGNADRVHAAVCRSSTSGTSTTCDDGDEYDYNKALVDTTGIADIDFDKYDARRSTTSRPTRLSADLRRPCRRLQRAALHRRHGLPARSTPTASRRSTTASR